MGRIKSVKEGMWMRERERERKKKREERREKKPIQNKSVKSFGYNEKKK